MTRVEASMLSESEPADYDGPPCWVRYRLDDGSARLGVCSGEAITPAPESAGIRVAELVRRPDLAERADELAAQRPLLAREEVTLLTPLDPDARVFCVAKNYRAHAAELGEEAPGAPAFFTRHPASLVGPGQALVRPAVSECHDFEAELAVIVGRPGRHITPADALAHVAAYCVLNDGSIRDFQRQSFTAGKNFDASGAMGPGLVPAARIADPHELAVGTWLNGERVQEGRTAQMIHRIPALIAYLSQVTALRSGDVIATGTPPGVGWARTPPLWLRPGDRVVTAIEGVGVLANDVVLELAG